MLRCPCTSPTPPRLPLLLQGEAGEKFYIIKAGEAVVLQKAEDGSEKKVNHLFKADYFGEQALLTSAPRCGLPDDLTAFRTLQRVQLMQPSESMK